MSKGRASGWDLIRQAIEQQRAGLAVGMLVAVLWTMSRVAVPWLVQRAIDDGIAGDGSLLPWMLIIAAAGVVSGVFTGMRRFFAFRNARRTEVWLRDRLFSHVQRMHFAFHDSVQTGDLMSRANTDLQQFQNLITMVPVTAGNIVVVVLVTGLLFSTNVGLAALALVFLPFVTVLGRRFGQRLHPAVMGVQAESAQLAAVVEETVSGVRVMKGFGSEPLQADRLATEANDLFGESMRAATIRSRFLPAVELLPNLGLILVLWWGGRLVLRDELTIGQLVGFNIYVAMLIQPLRMLGMIIANAQRANAAGQRIQAVLTSVATIVDPEQPTPLPPVDEPGHVVLRGVGFSYPDEGSSDRGKATRVLHDLDLEIAPGETVALVGATGSGKSTIARLLPRFYDITAGSITLDGVDVRALRLADLRRAVSIVFEETFLFSTSVGENIAFANPTASHDEIVTAARLAGAHEFITELAEGYNTLIGERGYSLSGGQRQRVAIARAVLANPRVVILDDATSAVDPTTEHEIRDALAEVIGRRTTIVIAHRPATIALADRVLLLDQGRIVAEGTHEHLLATSRRYQEVLAAAERTTADEATPANPAAGPHTGPAAGPHTGPDGGPHTGPQTGSNGVD